LDEIINDMEKVGFLQEKPGVSSINRMIFMAGSFWNMLLCSWFAIKNVDPALVLAVYSGVQGTLIGLKLGQKSMEKENKPIPQG
jgi:hypothetical protein